MTEAEKKAKEAAGEQIVEETIELDAKALEGISSKVAEQLLPQLQEAAKSASAEQVTEIKALIDTLDKGIKKNVTDAEEVDDANDPVAKGMKAGLFSEDMSKESKEMRLFKAARALANGDLMELKRYNTLSGALRQKAGYMNETTDADGAVLVPDPEFDTTVYENLPKYGVAFRDATVRQTDRNAVYVLTLDSGLEFYATAEAAVKTSAKLAFSRKLTELQKYAVIVPATDELTEDAAIDFWNLVTQELTRAYAKKADEITFTDSTYGITNTTGVIIEAVSGAGTTITWGDLLDAEGKGEDDADTSNSKWYMRKETWFRLSQLRYDAGAGAGTGGYLFQPNPNQPITPWGTPVVFTRVLPTSAAVGANDAFAVYGDLSNYILYTKRGMQLKVLTEATIKETDGSTDFNLATQDGTAMRAVVRMLGVLPKGNAGKFVVLGTGTVS
jgi:HK97 family phage major capsid protein